MSRLVKLVVPLGILAVAALGAGYLWATREPVEPRPTPEKEWIVATVAAERGDARPTMRAFGEIVAGRQVQLRPLVAGRVVEVGDDFVDGGVVREGDLLIAVDRFDYAADAAEYEARLAEARARLDEIEAELARAEELLVRDREQVELARRDVERRDRLRGTAAGSEKALDDARLALSQRAQQAITREQTIAKLTAQAEQQRAVIDRWQVSLERARRDLADTRLVAPFAGYLADTDAEVGKRVDVGDRIARLIDAGRLEARFHLSDHQFARLVEAGGYRGREAEVAWRVGDHPFVFAATIVRLESETAAESGGVELYARIAGGGIDGVLRPGAFVEVRVPDRTYEDVVRLPESALHDGDTVYAVVDGRLDPRSVAVAVRDGNDVLVRGDVAPGDVIVTTRFPEIGAGVRVAVR